MKSIFLSVVVICALAIAGVGGTFAGYSDTDMATGNILTTGSMDLKIYDPSLAEWVDTATNVITLTGVNPCNYVSGYIDVWNAGDCPDGGDLYLKIKGTCCSNVPVEHSGYTWVKPEPEVVTEEGGFLNQVEIDGIGIVADACSMRSHTILYIYNLAGNVVWSGPVLWWHENADAWVFLGTMPPCVPDEVRLEFHIPQVHESEYGVSYFPDGSPFEWWPTNGLQSDKLTFDVEFALLQAGEAHPNTGY